MKCHMFDGFRNAVSVTAPAIEVTGISGLSTNAMPLQGDYFMASMSFDCIET